MDTKLLRKNMLVLLGYSVAFMILGGWVDIIGLHWFALVAHGVVLFTLGIRALAQEGTKAVGQQQVLAGLLVLLVGHGLCFFNGLLHFNVH
jgi:hypothetical protein